MEPERQIEATAAEYFGGMVESYDSLIRRCVPRYDEMTQRLVGYVPGEPRRILELGCGTGNLTLQLRERFPDAKIVFVDASEEMLELTRHRLEARPGSGQGQGVRSTFEELSGSVEGPFDLVTSCIALHHVVDKGPLYDTIAGLLRDGGTLRFADQLRGATEFNYRENETRWLAFCREPGHCTEAEIQSLLDHAAAHDHYTPLAEHFRLLEERGFTGMDCVWRNLIWGIVTADRP